MAISLDSVISKAREITGNKVSTTVGELGVPDGAILVVLKPRIRDLNQKIGSNGSRKEVKFSLVPGQQDYPLATIAGDIGNIQEVIRQAATLPEHALYSSGWVNPRTGCDEPHHIPDGIGLDAADHVILGQRRAMHASQFDWEIIGDALRLFPCPEGVELCVVQYMSTGSQADTLPDDAETALIYAACVAILDSVCNRIMSDRLTGKRIGMTDGNPIVAQERLQLLTGQRDYYQQLYLTEYERLGR